MKAARSGGKPMADDLKRARHLGAMAGHSLLLVNHIAATSPASIGQALVAGFADAFGASLEVRGFVSAKFLVDKMELTANQMEE